MSDSVDAMAGERAVWAVRVHLSSLPVSPPPHFREAREGTHGSPLGGERALAKKSSLQQLQSQTRPGHSRPSWHGHANSVGQKPASSSTFPLTDMDVVWITTESACKALGI